LHGFELAVDVTLGTEDVEDSRGGHTLTLAPLTLAFCKDWSGLGDLQPVGTRLVAVAFAGWDASLLPKLILAVIEHLSRWTLTFLPGKDAVGILAVEKESWIADAYFILPHLPGGERRFIQAADFEVGGANVSFPILENARVALLRNSSQK